MRQIMIAVFMLCSLVTKAQKAELPDESQMSIADYLIVYGSVEEIRFEKNIMRNSSHGYLTMLAGGKAIWVFEMLKYLVGELHCCKSVANDTVSMVPQWYRVKPSCIEYPGMDTSSIYIRIKQDTNYRIKKVIITGNEDKVISLFTGYWECGGMDFDEDKISKGVRAVKNCGSDKVTISKINGKVQIEVSKNNRFPIALPQQISEQAYKAAEKRAKNKK